MALVVGNKQIQSIIPKYDGAGVLTEIIVRVNRSIVDDATSPATVKYGLSTSRDVDILTQLTPNQATNARAFLNRLAALVATMPEFEA